MESKEDVRTSESVRTESTSGQDEQQVRQVTGLRWFGLVLALLVSEFLFSLDTTVVANIRPAIIQDLGHVDKLSWITVAYVLGETSVNPVWGNLYTRFDNKILYCSALLIFNIGSAVCGSAPSSNALIVGNVIAGVGGCGIIVGNFNILAALTGPMENAIYMSYVGIAWCIGTIVGPSIGGAWSDSHATWRWAFYMNPCISALVAPICLFAIPKNPSGIKSEGFKSLRRLDFLGMVLFAGAIACFIMATSFGGQIYDWNDPRTIVLLVLTFVLWIAFGTQQAFCIFTTPENRAFPAFFFMEKEMCLLFVEAMIGMSCVFTPIYFIPLFYQFIRGTNAVESGVKTLPFLFTGVAACLTQGALFPKFSLYMPWYAVGGGLFLIGAALMTTLMPNLSDAHIYGYTVLLGIGSGTFTQLGYPVAHARQPANKQAAVVAFLSCAQTAGVTITLGIATSIFANRATDGIGQVLPEVNRSDIQAAITGVGSQFLQGLASETREQVYRVIAIAFQDVFILLAVWGGIAVLCSLFMERKRALPNQTTMVEEDKLSDQSA